MKKGERVRWYLIGLGNESDIAGTWMFHCHVADHMASGMMTRYTVFEAASEASHSQVRSDISAKLSATKRTFW